MNLCYEDTRVATKPSQLSRQAAGIVERSGQTLSFPMSQLGTKKLSPHGTAASATQPEEVVMTDRELIELAARAAGYKVIHSFENNDSLMIEVSERKYEVFNPLTSDADAFRLAVKLRLELGVSDEGDVFSAQCKRVLSFADADADDGDEYALMRLAITRAAAEIGRGMV